MFLRGGPFLGALSLAGSLKAHELLLQPESYEVAPGGMVAAEIRVGEEFEGSRNIFNPDRFRRLDVAVADSVVPVPGRLGDLPAAQVADAQEGLNILAYESTDLPLTYKEFAKFKKFAAHKDLDHLVKAHLAKNLPMEGFREVYSRYAKALVAVGDGAGQDRAFGLETEIVALANPYTDDLSKGLPVQVLYQGQPRADAQIELFERKGDTVTITLHRTDAAGQAVLPVQPGAEYMVDAVVGRAPDPALAEKLNAVWETLWANLTFAVRR